MMVATLAMVVRVEEDCLVVDKMMPARLVKSTAATSDAYEQKGHSEVTCENGQS